MEKSLLYLTINTIGMRGQQLNYLESGQNTMTTTLKYVIRDHPQTFLVSSYLVSFMKQQSAQN